MNFKQYMEDVYSQLNIIASEEYKEKHITYNYTPEQIKENLKYFKKSFKNDLSAYKALLFFEDFLEEKK